MSNSNPGTRCAVPACPNHAVSNLINWDVFDKNSDTLFGAGGTVGGAQPARVDLCDPCADEYELALWNTPDAWLAANPEVFVLRDIVPEWRGLVLPQRARRGTQGPR